MSEPTRDFWNSQFQMSAILPDFEEWPDRYTARSAEVLERLGTPERIETGPDPMQAVWHLPTGRPSHAVIFIHGGYWRRFAAADFHFAAEAAAAADATFYNVDYRLMPGVRMTEVVADCLAGVERATRDAERAVIVGHSAGGHLAVECALRLGRPPAAVVSVSGIFELAPLRSSFIDDELALTAEEVAAFSPLDRARSLPCPVDLCVGGDETMEFVRQSARFCDAVSQSGGEATFDLVPGLHHNAVAMELGMPESSIVRSICARLGNASQD